MTALSNQDIDGIGAHAISAKNNEVVENTTINSNKVSSFLHEDIYLKTSTSANVQLPADVLSFGTSDIQEDDDLPSETNSSTIPLYQKSHEPTVGVLSTIIPNNLVNIRSTASSIIKFVEHSKEAQPAMRNKWGRTSARKNLSMESIEYISDDESAVQRLESAKIDLETKLSEEIKVNAVLRSSFDGRRQALHEHRLTLEKEVVRLKELLHKERDLRSHLEYGLMSIQTGHLSTSACLDSNIMVDLEEIAVSVKDINNLKQNITDHTEQVQQGCITFCQSCGQPIYTRNERQENTDDIPIEHKKDNSLKHDNMKDEVKSFPFLYERQICQKTLPRILNESVGTYSETSLSEDRQGTSNKLAMSEGSKRDALESSYRRMSAQKKQPSILSLNSEKSKGVDDNIFLEERITLLRNNATRRHTPPPKGEEGFSSPFELTKLTNRLNFLKERRLQLANELQNLDSGRAIGTEAVLKTNNN